MDQVGKYYFFSGKTVINWTSAKHTDKFITNCVHNDARDSVRLFDVAMTFKQISGTSKVVC